MSKLLAQCGLIVVMFGLGLTLVLVGQQELGSGLIGSALGYTAAIFQQSPTLPNPAIPPGA